jgi:exodeoxyribonuclease-5
MNELHDQAARLVALTQLDRSFLFEAGAGSGKTSLLAGRVVGLFVKGIRPANIVAVSFTELAATELLGRIFDFATGLAEGRVPADIRAAYPAPLEGEPLANLRAALAEIGDMTCTTIHGFCQRLLRPYPVEAGIDPGAGVLDPEEASLRFEDVLDAWMRERLSGFDPDKDILTALVSHDPAHAVSMMRDIAFRLRGNPDFSVPHAPYDGGHVDDLAAAVEALRLWTASRAVCPADHADILDAWTRTAIAAEKAAGGLPHAAAVRVTLCECDGRIATKTGVVKYALKTAWKAIDKTDNARLNDEAKALHEACAAAFDAMKARAAAEGLRLLVEEVRPVLAEFARHKREAALLDFDDLLQNTRNLLRDHPDVLKSLRDMYTHVLVDEYQDTDPVQTEIFEMLSFDEVDGARRPVPGGIFFVGDPKQAIYRFRGADVSTYVRMREQMRSHDADSVQSIFVNFRSTTGIIDFVNGTFSDLLSTSKQPGFTALSSMRGAGSGPAVFRYAVEGSDSVDARRRSEAEKIADSVLHLINNHRIAQKDGTDRACMARDVALLAPVNTSLFWLENALEDRGIPVSTQAGKGLFQQQEIKDLIALTRVLGDPRDTLALGALLRGSFFGFSDEALLDAAAALPDLEDGRLNFLDLSTPVDDIADRDLARIVGTLERLRREAVRSTPFDTLSEAIDLFDVRAKTRNRDESNASRRLANIERYLDMSRAYDVRGMRAFSDSMRDKWENSERVQEGRPGGLENSVSIITIHSAKGLEWPVVFTVNCATAFNNRQTVFSDVRRSTFAMKFLKHKPTDFDAFVTGCREEDEAERVRLMYVALTRARDLLVVPDIEKSHPIKAWSDLVDLGLGALPHLESEQGGPRFRASLSNGPTLSKEERDAVVEAVARRRVRVVKRVPSSHEIHSGFHEHIGFDDLVAAVPDMNPYANIEGGVARGNILHKLMEEILNGEADPDAEAVEGRARELVQQILAANPEKPPKLHSSEIAGCVLRTLALPAVAALLPVLVPEVGVASAASDGAVETLVNGVADAVAVDGGKITCAVDWKSDLRPTRRTIDDYRSQLGDYVRIMGAERGMLVFMSTGTVLEVKAA